MRHVVWWLIVILVLFTSISGFVDSWRDLIESNGLGEKAVAASVLIYAVAGLISFYGMIRKRKWVMIPLYVWGFAVVFAATVATIVYSSDDAGWVGAVVAGICASALIALILVQVHREIKLWN